jgi:hypothetical protein
MKNRNQSKRKRGAAVRPSELVSRAFAWAIQDHKGKWTLCKWAQPDRARLIAEGKPSPEANIVRVTMRG